MPLSTATVSMVHSVPELMVSSEVSPPGWGAPTLWSPCFQSSRWGEHAVPGPSLEAGLGLGEQGSVKGRSGPGGQGQGLRVDVV